jgi:hypothetical protein
MQLWVNGSLVGEWNVTGPAQNYSTAATVAGNTIGFHYHDHLSMRLSKLLWTIALINQNLAERN